MRVILIMSGCKIDLVRDKDNGNNHDLIKEVINRLGC